LGSAEQGLAHDIEAGSDVRINRESREQGPQNAARVHVYARTRLIDVRNREYVDPAENADHPGDGDADPAEAPRAPQLVENLVEESLQIHWEECLRRRIPARSACHRDVL